MGKQFWTDLLTGLAISSGVTLGFGLSVVVVAWAFKQVFR